MTILRERLEPPKLVALYVRYLKLERNYSTNTIEAYQRDLKRLLVFMREKSVHPLDVDIELLQNFALSLHEQHVGARSQSRILSGVRAFYRYLLLDNFIEDDPTELLEFPSVAMHLPEVLSVEEVDRLEQSIDLSKPEGHRNRAIIEVMFSCGLRVSELVNLKISSIYKEEEFIRVCGKGNKERLVPISKSALCELDLWYAQRREMKIKKGEEDYVFLNRRGAHLTRTMVLIMIKRQAIEAGINKTISPHTLRHSFATALLRGGADLRVIQAMLGHEDIATTEIYTHMDASMLRNEILYHHPRNIKYSQKKND